MAKINLRLSLLALRQKINFRFVRLLLVLFYILVTGFVVLITFGGSSKPSELLFDQDRQVDDKFLVIGGLKKDFRIGGSQDSSDLPLSVRQFESLVENGKGENGKSVTLGDKEKKKAEELQKKWAFNKVVSDKVSLWRSLPDIASSQCAAIQYDSDLPTASVVIIFNNEALSALLRTVWSVLDRSPESLLHEVILVDDASNHTEITETLPDYIKHRLPPKVGLVRSTEQGGLIRARLAGAKVATGDFIVFLDSHCEATKGWLEPMAQRIKEDPTVVQIPIIDMIDATSLSYYGSGGGSVSVGGFTWSGHFTWEGLPAEVAKTRKATDPAKTATMAGGLFAVSRDFFWKVGGYDEGMTGWGGENLELSFRVWRCGGSMEMHPCSHVGHIFRPFHPYFIPHDSHGINTARMAEVWMDEYKRFFYMHRADLINSPDIGDLTERRAIVDRLSCKSFKWFLENVYPHKFVMDDQSIAWGRLRAKKGDKTVCIDHLQRDMAHKGTSYDLGEYPCHPYLGDSQYFAVSKEGQFRNEYMCGEVSNTRENQSKLKMVTCNVKNQNQMWSLSPKGQLKQDVTGLCLDMGVGEAGQDVLLTKCDDNNKGQIWKFDFYTEGKESWDPELK